MITPAFKCSQNDNFIIVTISLPNVRMNNMEYSIVDNTFRFYVKPYFLRLTFAEDENFSNDGSDYAKYDADESVLYAYLPKREQGVEWKDLDMVTRLLSSGSSLPQPQLFSERQQTSTSTSSSSSSTDKKSFSFDEEKSAFGSGLNPFPSTEKKRPLIEVISEENFEDAEEDNVEMRENLNKPDFDFSWGQTARQFPDKNEKKRDTSLLGLEVEMEEEEPVKIQIKPTQYGFDQQYSDYFTNYTHDLIAEVIDLATPESSEPAERTTMRMEQEAEAFDVDHYLADYFNDESIQELMKYRPRFMGKKKEVTWNEVEQTMLQNLPKKRYLLNDEKAVYLSLVDILCAYCYNHRTFLGENTVESGWTIAKLSASLSWFEKFDSLQYCVKTFVGRALCFPLYRHLRLAIRCVEDVVALLRSGKAQILRCLLEMKYILEHSPGSGQYLLAKLYINDYCSWIQNENENRFQLLANEIEQCITKLTPAEFPEFQLEKIAQFADENVEEMRQAASQFIDESRPQELLM